MKKTSWGQLLLGFGLALGSFLPTPATAQYSNEWINFSQTYYKIPVAKDGVYRISYSALQAAGVPLGSIDPRRINLFHRGVEQSILVQGQDDAIFDPSDFIEFYGRKNDGTLDADLYHPSSLQPHPYYNLYSDTAAYFLTWNPLPVQGKRMTSFSEAQGSLTKESYHSGERLVVYSAEYSGGLTISNEVQATAFDTGEGWTGPGICIGSSGCIGQGDLVIDNLTGLVVSSGSPELEVVVVGRAENSRQVEIYVGQNSGSLRLLTSVSLTGFESAKLTLQLDNTDIGADGKMTVRAKIVGSDLDQISVSSIKVSFPQSFNISAASEKFFHLIPNGSGKSYVELLNPPMGARIWDITDTNNVKIIGSNAISGGIGAVVPNTSAGRALFVTGSTNAVALRKISFRQITPSAHNFIIISHRSLMKPALGYGDVVQGYAGYRASTEGGGYDTLTVAIDQLYNQFNYGETSPRAIYQLMKFLVAGGHPKYLFIIGKGTEVSAGFYRKASIPPTDLRDLVPSAGMPASDMVFTAGLGGMENVPAVPTGRLSATTPQQVAAYLNKVKESESLTANELWRKDILHLSGGINPGEPELFRQYVDGFKTIAENIFLGGKVETISKQTLNVELVNVKDQVNKGLNLITFYGHSGPGTIDVDIGYVSDPTLGYNNQGKYPGFLINGCNAGRFFDNRLTFGEDWIFTANKGAKSFIAHSSFGLTSTLKQYSDLFYSVAYGDSAFIGKGVGDVQKEVAQRYLSLYLQDIFSVSQVQQMFLLGDPAVKLFDSKKPDYDVSNNSVAVVSLDGKAVTAQSDSFAIDIGLKNFGRAIPSMLKIRVERTLGDNSTVVYDSIFDPLFYAETVRFKIRRGKSKAEFGNARFKIIVDPDNDVPELDENNNVAQLDFFIPLNGTKNLFPPPYAIVSTDILNLVFQNTNLLADTRSFRIEVDTASTFDSPYLKRQSKEGKVLVSLPYSLLNSDSTVYYWRTKIENPLPEETIEWTSSSFVYIRNSPTVNNTGGWAQAKFPQFLDDPLVGLVSDPEIGRLKFLETVSTVDVKTFGNANPTPVTEVSLKINQEEYNLSTQGQSCRNNSLNLIVFDKGSSAPYAGIPFNFQDPRTCGREPQMINSFTFSEMLTGNGDDLAQWVFNIKPSDSVVVFTIGDVGYAFWSTGVKFQLEHLGVAITQLDGVQPGEPFVIFGRKGATPGTAMIFRPLQAPGNEQELSVSKTVTGRYMEGSLTSTLIGPASHWSTLTAKIAEASASDQYAVSVTGVDLSGNEMILKNQLTGGADLSDIDALQYPYMKLTLQMKDEIDLTPVQLKKWLVTYSPVPEGLLVYNGNKNQEHVQEGEEWKSDYAFANISSNAFTDSVSVKVDFSSPSGKKQQSLKIKPPSPGETVPFKISLNTKGSGGSNDIGVFVNPYLQAEQYYDNNVLTLFDHLVVEKDHTAPLLQVKVDGRQLVNNDLVSASPKIELIVVDKNIFMPKTDTLGINLYLQYPCTVSDCPFQRINFSRKDVSWSPAAPGTDFRMVFKPKNLAAGEYTLKAEAIDGSGNLSGADPYAVTFEVSDDIGFLLQSVYPNPSSDQFFFKIFLSGPETPQDFHLEVFSAGGGRIRTFGNEVLNVLHVGTNELSMKATDAQGNPLPAGVYVFRMTVVTGGTQFSKSGKLVVR